MYRHLKFVKESPVTIIKLKISSFIEPFLKAVYRPIFLNESDYCNLRKLTKKSKLLLSIEGKELYKRLIKDRAFMLSLTSDLKISNNRKVMLFEDQSDEEEMILEIKEIVDESGSFI